MAKQILYGVEARQKLKHGVDALTDAVASTLGPRGQNVAIDRGYDMLVVHDGVTVAKHIELADIEENAGVRMLREAANKQVEQVGDGTTVVTILARAIVDECLKITSTGVNAMSLRLGLEQGQQKLIAKLEAIAKPVKTLEEKIQVATISAEDKNLGEMIGDIVHKMGADGVITVEESKGTDTFIEHQEGMQFAKGYKASYFITDPDRMEATVEDTFVFITDRTITNYTEILPILDKMVQKQLPRVTFICQDMTDSALGTCVATKLKGGMLINVVTAPLAEQKMKDFLEDIAILTNGTVISADKGMRLEDAELEHLGRAVRITSTKDATLIVGGKGEKSAIKERIAAIRSQLERDEGSEWEQEKLKERIAKLTGGVAVIKVGGQTEIEMKERKERADDAVHATQAAVAEGIVPGGEIVYLLIRKEVKDNPILYKALYQPFKKLLENAGLEAAEYTHSLSMNLGVDVTTGNVIDLLKAGIIDPVRVSKSAIRNAVSVAIQIMTTNTLITEIPKETTANGTT